MAFRFLHIADAHLDSPLRSLALRNAGLAEAIGTATRRAFAHAIELCLEEKVDALLIAGDLYDGDQTSMRTALFLGTELKRLDDAGIGTFIIRGNHDHLARITKELILPDRVKVFGGRAEAVTIRGSGRPIAIHGLSFAQAHATESLLPRYRPPVEDAVNVGLMHTSLNGSPGHDPYAPCSVKDLEASGFGYWALGHIHARSAYEGACAVVMPGMLQGRDAGESGPKSATLVRIADDGAISFEERLTSIAQFERIAVDISSAQDWPGVVNSIGAALTRAREAAVSEQLVARLTLTGASRLTWRIRRDADLVATEAQACAEALGRTWIDKVEIGHSMFGHAVADAGPLKELRHSMLNEVGASQATTLAVREAIEDLRRHLPAECRDLLGDSDDAVEALTRSLTLKGSDEVLARLIPASEGQP